MGKLVNLTRYRRDAETKTPAELSITEICSSSEHTQIYDIEQLTLQVDSILSDYAERQTIPLAVAMAAGRYAALRLFERHGRAEAMAFFEDCIQTAEICQDVLREMGDDTAV